jgi:hypothetical protein
MRWAAAACSAIGLLLAGCGYTDDNPRAAALVAQAYVDAVDRHDAAAVCRVLAPEAQAGFAAGKTCEGGLAGHLRPSATALRVGRVREVPGPPGNPRFNVAIPARPGSEITVGRYGSIWRIIGGGGLIE